METNPNYVNLFGSIEVSYSRAGIGQTDFTMIKAGSFLKANGGYLVINALDALVEPGVWATLKRTLRNQIFEIQNYLQMYLFSSARLKPEPIKSDVKVVMIGDASIYNLLYFMDEDFKKIFKIKAEFDSEMDKGEKAVGDYVRFIKKICDEDGLLPLDKDGIAALIEYATRIAGRQRKLSTRFHVIADVIRESSYWAGKDKKSAVGRDDVEKAIRERFERVSLIEDKIQEMIEEGTILIDTEGAVVGQVNGLSVYDMGQFMFGKPTRITARTAMGRAGVINIEREADMSGPTHNKGVLILGGYLRGKYASKRPLLSGRLPGLRAVLRRRRRRQRLVDRGLRHPLEPVGPRPPPGPRGHRVLEPEGRDPADRRGQRKDRGLLRRLPGQGPDRDAGRHHPPPERSEPHAPLRRRLRGPGGEIPCLSREDDRRGHRDPDGRRGRRVREDGSYEEGTVHGLVDRELQRLASGWKSFSGGNDRGEGQAGGPQ